MNGDHPDIGTKISPLVPSRRTLLRAATLGVIAGATRAGLRSVLAANSDFTRPPIAAPASTNFLAPVGKAAPTERPVSLAGSGDKLYAKLPVGEWASASAYQTIRYALARYAPNYRDFGDTGITAITTAWSGAAFDPNTGTFYVMGGGHHDSNFNGIVSLSAETGLVAVPIHPSILTAAEVAAIKASWPSTNPWNDWGRAMYPGYEPPGTRPGPYAGYVYSNGLPGASHTYGCMWFDIATGRVIQLNSFWSEYDISTGKVVRLTLSPGGRGTNSFGLRVGSRLIGINTKSDDYWDFKQFDLKTRVETFCEMGVPYQPGIAAAYSFNSKTFGCAIGTRLYFVDTAPAAMTFGDPTSWFVDVKEVAAKYMAKVIPVVSPWSATDMIAVQSNTMAFDTDSGLLYIPSKDWSYFLIWNPLTGECNKMNVRGGLPKMQTNSAYGRFQYYAKRKCLVLVNSIDEPLYYLKVI